MNPNHKKILIFSLSYFPGNVGGAEVAVKEITDRILDYNFDLICFGKPAFVPERIGNVNVYQVGGWVPKNKSDSPGIIKKILFIWFAFFKASRLHRKKEYYAVWAIMAGYAGIVGCLIKFFHPKIKFVLSLQEGDNFKHPKRKLIRFIYKSIIKRADSIQAISNFLAEWAREMGAKVPIVVIPNGVDYEKFKREIEPVKLEAIKKEIRKNKDDIFLITASRLVMKNAVADTIKSLEYLEKNIKLLILGAGELEKELKALCNKMRLEERVIFKGFVSHDDLPKYLKVADIFVRPSLSEGFGNSFVEAMAAGIPVIATPVGGIVDFLKDEETGLFCEIGNPKNIAQKVEKLIRDKESRDYIVTNAKKMVAERYDWKKISAEMMKIY